MMRLKMMMIMMVPHAPFRPVCSPPFSCASQRFPSARSIGSMARFQKCSLGLQEPQETCMQPSARQSDRIRLCSFGRVPSARFCKLPIEARRAAILRHARCFCYGCPMPVYFYGFDGTTRTGTSIGAKLRAYSAALVCSLMFWRQWSYVGITVHATDHGTTYAR